MTHDDDEAGDVSWEEFQRVRAAMIAELGALAHRLAMHRARAVLQQCIQDGRPLAEVAREATAAGTAIIDGWHDQADRALPDLPADGRWH